MSSDRITTSPELAQYLQENDLNVAALASEDGQSKPGGWWRMRLAGASSGGRMVVHFDRAGRSNAWVYLEDLVRWAQAKGNAARYEEAKERSERTEPHSGSMSGALMWATKNVAQSLNQALPTTYATAPTELTINDNPILIGMTGVAMYARADRSGPTVKVTARAAVKPTSQGAQQVSVHFMLLPDRGGPRALHLNAALGAVADHSVTRTLTVPCSYRSRKGDARSGLVTIELGVFVPKVTAPATAATP
jgi:hypothetical protein